MLFFLHFFGQSLAICNDLCVQVHHFNSNIEEFKMNSSSDFSVLESFKYYILDFTMHLAQKIHNPHFLSTGYIQNSPLFH